MSAKKPDMNIGYSVNFKKDSLKTDDKDIVVTNKDNDNSNESE